MQYKFFVSGMQPVNRDVNAFLQACDLGMEGVFTPFHEEVTVTRKAPNPQLADIIRQAYEQAGYRNILVVQEAHAARG